MGVATDTPGNAPGLTPLQKRLLGGFQRDFPLSPAPYADIARRLGVGEAEAIAALRQLQVCGAVRGVGAVVRPRSVGVNTLAAMTVPSERLPEVAPLVAAYAEVKHRCEREHKYNLWFVLAAGSRQRLRQVLFEIERRTGLAALDLPMLEDYRTETELDARYLNDRDRCLLDAVEAGLPVAARPYAETGERLGMTETEVIARLRALQARGMLKRLGVAVRRHETGGAASAMAVWDVPNGAARAVGRRFAGFGFVTRCYRRSRRLPAWPYNVFCMISARDRREILDNVARLAEGTGLEQTRRQVLFSRDPARGDVPGHSPDVS